MVIEITKLLIGVIVGVAVLQGMFIFYGSMYSEYGDTTIQNNYSTNLLNYTQQITGEFEESENSWIKQVPILGDAWTLAANGWAALGMLFEAPTLLMQIVSESITGSQVLPDNYWLIAIINGIIWLILISAVIKAVFQRDI